MRSPNQCDKSSSCGDLFAYFFGQQSLPHRFKIASWTWDAMQTTCILTRTINTAGFHHCYSSPPSSQNASSTCVANWLNFPCCISSLLSCPVEFEFLDVDLLRIPFIVNLNQYNTMFHFILYVGNRQSRWESTPGIQIFFPIASAINALLRLPVRLKGRLHFFNAVDAAI